MKISKYHNIVFKQVENEKLNIFNNSFPVESSILLNSRWKLISSEFNKIKSGYIDCLSKNYMNAVNRASESLLKDFSGHTYAGIMIFNANSYVYYIDSTVKNKTTGFIFNFRKGNFVYFCDLGLNVIMLNETLSKNDTEVRHLMGQTVKIIVCSELFKKYAEIEQKIITKNFKTKDFNCKYINECDYDINYLTSNYFTEILRTSGFNVRGHFRLQPYKNTKKIIWIDEFKKHGYKRKAIIQNG